MTMSDTRAKRRMGGRLGANAIEFALILPVFVVIMFSIIEFSLMFFVRSQVVNAVRDGCRAGAVTPQDEAPDDVARQRMADDLTIFVNCDESSCVSTATITGVSPEESLYCTLDVTYNFLLTGGSINLSASALALFELQDG